MRLLARDAEWLFKWGEGWTLDANGQLIARGTPVIVIGAYAFGSPAPWLAASPAAKPIALPDPLPINR